MTGSIINPFKKDIFKGYSPLTAKVKFTDYLKHLFYSICPLNWHQFSSLFIKRRVQTDSKMAAAFFKKFLNPVYKTDSTYRDPGRAPSVSPVIRKYIKTFKNFCNVV